MQFPKPKPTPYNLRMVDQTTTKPMGLIKDLKIYICSWHSLHNYIVATLALGSRPRQRGCKVAGQEEGSPGVKSKALQGCGPRGSQGVTSHTPGSVRKCEGV